MNAEKTVQVLDRGSTIGFDMVNAITEFARDITDINRRESIERLAFKAA